MLQPNILYLFLRNSMQQQPLGLHSQIEDLADGSRPNPKRNK